MRLFNYSWIETDKRLRTRNKRVAEFVRYKNIDSYYPITLSLDRTNELSTTNLGGIWRSFPYTHLSAYDIVGNYYAFIPQKKV